MSLLRRLLRKSLSGSLSLSGETSARLKHSFSRQHLAAAAYFARRSADIEASLVAPNEDEKSQHRAYVTGTILSAVAFLESSVNEFYLEAVDNNKNPLGSLSDSAVSSLASAWPQVESLEILEKFQKALNIASLPQFNKGNPPFQDAASLVKLRNALVHYKSEWDDQAIVHSSLKQRLAVRFKPNPYAPTGSLWFPHLCLGAGCASWSVDTATSFLHEFCSRMTIPRRY